MDRNLFVRRSLIAGRLSPPLVAMSPASSPRRHVGQRTGVGSTQGENVSPNSPNGADGVAYHSVGGGFRSVKGFMTSTAGHDTSPSLNATPTKQIRKRKLELGGSRDNDAQPTSHSASATANKVNRAAQGHDSVNTKKMRLIPAKTAELTCSSLGAMAAMAAQQHRQRSLSESSAHSTDSAASAQDPQDSLSASSTRTNTPVHPQPTGLSNAQYPSFASLPFQPRKPQQLVQPVQRSGWSDLHVHTATTAKGRPSGPKAASQQPKPHKVARSRTQTKRTKKPTVSTAASLTSSASTSSSSTQGPSYDTVPKKSGRWTDEEHQVFVRGLRKHGKNWSVISQMVRTRTTVQVRTHAQKFFLKQQRAGLNPMEDVGGPREQQATSKRATSSANGRANPSAAAAAAAAARSTAAARSHAVQRGVSASSLAASATAASATRQTQQHRRRRRQAQATGVPGQHIHPAQAQVHVHRQRAPQQPHAMSMPPSRMMMPMQMPMQMVRPPPQNYAAAMRQAAGPFQRRIPSVLLNRPQSPASTRTIRTAATHLMNMFSYGSTNSGICEPVY